MVFTETLLLAAGDINKTARRGEHGVPGARLTSNIFPYTYLRAFALNYLRPSASQLMSLRELQRRRPARPAAV